MDREVNLLVKKWYNRLFEVFKEARDAADLTEEVMVFLLVAGKLSAEKPDKLFWHNLFDEYFPVINRYTNWFTERHRDLTVQDDFVAGVWQEIGKRFKDNPAVVLGILHETALGVRQPARKRQGVYYTPPEIVNYMIEKTLGPIISEYTEKFRRAVNDPAAEITVLLEELREFRVVDPACGSAAFLITVLKHLTAFYQKLPAAVINDGVGNMALRHLYGMDNDRRAVDLTILGLVLGAGKDSIGAVEEMLGILRKHIRFGDTLTANWQESFPEVFSGNNPGFALVIGNPPYISNKLLAGPVKDYIKNNYHTAQGQYDIIVPFIEKGLNSLRTGGRLCFIISNKYLAADYGVKLRQEVLTRHNLLRLTDLSSLNVFGGAAVYPVIQLIEKGAPPSDGQVIISEINDIKGLKEKTTAVPVTFFRQMDNMLITSKLDALIWPVIEKINSFPGRLPAAKILCGIARTGFSKQIISPEIYRTLDKNDQKNYRKLIKSGNIDKHLITGTGGFIAAGATNEKQWKSFDSRKLVISGMAKNICAAVEEDGCALGRVYYIREEDAGSSLYYLSAIFNSKLIDFYYQVLYWPVHLQGGYYRFNSTYLACMPIISAEENPEIAARITDIAERMQKDKTSPTGLTDEIERLVFELYRFNEDEIAVVNKFLNGGN